MIKQFKNRFFTYMELTKPRIGLLVIITAYLGYYLGLRSGESHMLHSQEWITLIHLLLGMFLSCSGACAFNQIFERDIDSKMDRTKKRPLPLGKIKVANAYIFAICLFLFSTGYLYYFVNKGTSILSCITYLTYLFVYTPLKKRTTLNTLIGSIPGALPPIGGWMAATGSINSLSWILFAVLTCWQIPHFLSIAIIYSEDYKKGGLKMLPSVYPDRKITNIYIIFFTIALTCVSMGLLFIKGYGFIFASGSLLIGIIFIYFSTQLILSSSIKNAKRVFYYSIAYLPILIFLIIFS